MPVKIKSKYKKVNENKNYNKIKPYLKGVFIGDLLFIVGVIICGLILYKSDSTSSFFYYIPYVFMFFGAFFCGISVQKGVGGRGFLIGILSSLPYLTTIILFVCVFLRFNVSVNLLITIPVCLLGGFIGGIIAVNSRI